MKILVTGGRGFIGSHFVEAALERGYSVVDIDKMTYAAHDQLPWDNNKNYTLIKADISEIQHLPSCDVIMNFAAESHVDNSIRSSDVFVRSNFLGVHNLLELVRGKREYERPLFFHISTDEVYGDRVDGKFLEGDKLTPSNPYAATKAAAEMLILSYHRTYGLEYIISRSSNNYGERQFEEKLIPKTLQCIQENKPVPLHGDGSYIRDWTYVKDNVSGLLSILDSGIRNQTFNVSAENYLTNLQVVSTVYSWFNKEPNIKYVENRWGQDVRYAVDAARVRALGWQPEYTGGLHRWF